MELKKSYKKPRDFFKKKLLKELFLLTFLHVHASYLADRVLTLGSTTPKVAEKVHENVMQGQLKRKRGQIKTYKTIKMTQKMVQNII